LIPDSNGSVEQLIAGYKAVLDTVHATSRLYQFKSWNSEHLFYKINELQGRITSLLGELKESEFPRERPIIPYLVLQNVVRD